MFLQNEEFSMIVIVPNDIDGLAQLEEKLSQHDIGELLQKAHKTDVVVHLPKFKIESSLNLNKHLENVRIKRRVEKVTPTYDVKILSSFFV